MSLTGREVAEILRALEQSTFDTLDLEMNGVQIHLRRGAAANATPATAASTGASAAAASSVAGAAALPIPAPPAAQMPSTSDTRPMPRGDATPVTAPLLGIFYRAPKPGEAPFVQIGDRVEPDTIIGIIEVMKLMNTVRAGVAGQIVEISAANGEMVEYGQALLWVHRG
jgi:acetyl-CoA carboxylase biotin carboxyl carrier protein